MEKGLKHWFGKAGSAFFCVVALSFILAACKSEEDVPPAVELTDLTIQRWSRNEHLLALAVCRVYDGNGMSLKSAEGNMETSPLIPANSLKTDGYYPSIRYEFDCIKIGQAAHFIARGVNFPFLNEICGKGELEVILTSFSTYAYVGEAKEYLTDLVSDGLIVFRGELGIYSCMTNGGSSVRGVTETEFSSHKRFAGNAVEKNFAPPLFKFYIKTENNRSSLACTVVTDQDGNYLQQPPLQWTRLQGGDIVDGDKLFSTVELSAMPEISLQCTITGIGEDYFLVDSKSNLEKIYFDEYTRFFVDDEPATSVGFANGDIITVTFNQLFERYNPKVALANKIEK